MNEEKSLVIGFGKNDQERIQTTLERLVPHVELAQTAIAGGLAIRYYIASHGLSYPPRSFNDLDVIMTKMEALYPSVAKDFLIAEYHPPKSSHYFIIKVVDPISKIKVDFFPYYPSSPDRAIKVPVGNHRVNVVGLEDQLVKSVYDTQKVNRGAKIDPKQFFDANLLAKIADLDLADRLWQDRFSEQYPFSLREAMKRAEEGAQEHQELVVEDPFRDERKKDFCEDCVEVPGFPLTPRKKIREIMGY